jgi:hypothetical protein
MNPDELKGIWAQQPASSAGVVRLTPEIIWRLASESARFKRTIFWRDVREWLATIFVAGVFLYSAFGTRDRIDWPMVAAAIIACLPMTYVAVRRPKNLVPENNAALAEHLRNAIAYVQEQLELLRSVCRWYLGPLAVSAAIVLIDVFFKAPVPAHGRMFLTIPFLLGAGVFAAVFYAVWKINDYAARKHLEPRLRELKQTLADIEKD